MPHGSHGARNPPQPPKTRTGNQRQNHEQRPIVDGTYMQPVVSSTPRVVRQGNQTLHTHAGNGDTSTPTASRIDSSSSNSRRSTHDKGDSQTLHLRTQQIQLRTLRPVGQHGHRHGSKRRPVIVANEAMVAAQLWHNLQLSHGWLLKHTANPPAALARTAVQASLLPRSDVILPERGQAIIARVNAKLHKPLWTLLHRSHELSAASPSGASSCHGDKNLHHRSTPPSSHQAVVLLSAPFVAHSSHESHVPSERPLRHQQHLHWQPAPLSPSSASSTKANNAKPLSPHAVHRDSQLQQRQTPQRSPNPESRPALALPLITNDTAAVDKLDSAVANEHLSLAQAEALNYNSTVVGTKESVLSSMTLAYLCSPFHPAPSANKQQSPKSATESALTFHVAAPEKRTIITDSPQRASLVLKCLNASIILHSKLRNIHNPPPPEKVLANHLSSFVTQIPRFHSVDAHGRPSALPPAQSRTYTISRKDTIQSAISRIQSQISKVQLNLHPYFFIGNDKSNGSFATPAMYAEWKEFELDRLQCILNHLRELLTADALLSEGHEPAPSNHRSQLGHTTNPADEDNLTPSRDHKNRGSAKGAEVADGTAHGAATKHKANDRDSSSGCAENPDNGDDDGTAFVIPHNYHQNFRYVLSLVIGFHLRSETSTARHGHLPQPLVDFIESYRLLFGIDRLHMYIILFHHLVRFFSTDPGYLCLLLGALQAIVTRFLTMHPFGTSASTSAARRAVAQGTAAGRSRPPRPRSANSRHVLSTTADSACDVSIITGSATDAPHIHRPRVRPVVQHQHQHQHRRRHGQHQPDQHQHQHQQTQCVYGDGGDHDLDGADADGADDEKELHHRQLHGDDQHDTRRRRYQHQHRNVDNPALQPNSPSTISSSSSPSSMSADNRDQRSRFSTSSSTIAFLEGPESEEAKHTFFQPFGSSDSIDSSCTRAMLATSEVELITASLQLLETHVISAMTNFHAEFETPEACTHHHHLFHLANYLYFALGKFSERYVFHTIFPLGSNASHINSLLSLAFENRYSLLLQLITGVERDISRVPIVSEAMAAIAKVKAELNDEDQPPGSPPIGMEFSSTFLQQTRLLEEHQQRQRAGSLKQSRAKHEGAFSAAASLFQKNVSAAPSAPTTSSSSSLFWPSSSTPSNQKTANHHQRNPHEAANAFNASAFQQLLLLCWKDLERVRISFPLEVIGVHSDPSVLAARIYFENLLPIYQGLCKRLSDGSKPATPHLNPFMSRIANFGKGSLSGSSTTNTSGSTQTTDRRQQSSALHSVSPSSSTRTERSGSTKQQQPPPQQHEQTHHQQQQQLDPFSSECMWTTVMFRSFAHFVCENGLLHCNKFSAYSTAAGAFVTHSLKHLAAMAAEFMGSALEMESFRPALPHAELDATRSSFTCSSGIASLHVLASVLAASTRMAMHLCHLLSLNHRVQQHQSYPETIAAVAEPTGLSSHLAVAIDHTILLIYSVLRDYMLALVGTDIAMVPSKVQETLDRGFVSSCEEKAQHITLAAKPAPADNPGRTNQESGRSTSQQTRTPHEHQAAKTQSHRSSRSSSSSSSSSNSNSAGVKSSPTGSLIANSSVSGPNSLVGSEISIETSTQGGRFSKFFPSLSKAKYMQRRGIDLPQNKGEYPRNHSLSFRELISSETSSQHGKRTASVASASTDGPAKDTSQGAVLVVSKGGLGRSADQHRPGEFSPSHPNTTSSSRTSSASSRARDPRPQATKGDAMISSSESMHKIADKNKAAELSKSCARFFRECLKVPLSQQVASMANRVNETMFKSYKVVYYTESARLRQHTTKRKVVVSSATLERDSSVTSVREYADDWSVVQLSPQHRPRRASSSDSALQPNVPGDRSHDSFPTAGPQSPLRRGAKTPDPPRRQSAWQEHSICASPERAATASISRGHAQGHARRSPFSAAFRAHHHKQQQPDGIAAPLSRDRPSLIPFPRHRIRSPRQHHDHYNQAVGAGDRRAGLSRRRSLKRTMSAPQMTPPQRMENRQQQQQQQQQQRAQRTRNPSTRVVGKWHLAVHGVSGACHWTHFVESSPRTGQETGTHQHVGSTRLEEVDGRVVGTATTTTTTMEESGTCRLRRAPSASELPTSIPGSPPRHRPMHQLTAATIPEEPATEAGSRFEVPSVGQLPTIDHAALVDRGVRSSELLVDAIRKTRRVFESDRLFRNMYNELLDAQTIPDDAYAAAETCLRYVYDVDEGFYHRLNASYTCFYKIVSSLNEQLSGYLKYYIGRSLSSILSHSTALRLQMKIFLRQAFRYHIKLFLRRTSLFIRRLVPKLTALPQLSLEPLFLYLQLILADCKRHLIPALYCDVFERFWFATFDVVVNSCGPGVNALFAMSSDQAETMSCVLDQLGRFFQALEPELLPDTKLKSKSAQLYRIVLMVQLPAAALITLHHLICHCMLVDELARLGGSASLYNAPNSESQPLHEGRHPQAPLSAEAQSDVQAGNEATQEAAMATREVFAVTTPTPSSTHGPSTIVSVSTITPITVGVRHEHRARVGGGHYTARSGGSSHGHDDDDDDDDDDEEEAVISSAQPKSKEQRWQGLEEKGVKTHSNPSMEREKSEALDMTLSADDHGALLTPETSMYAIESQDVTLDVSVDQSQSLDATSPASKTSEKSKLPCEDRRSRVDGEDHDGDSSTTPILSGLVSPRSVRKGADQAAVMGKTKEGMKATKKLREKREKREKKSEHLRKGAQNVANSAVGSSAITRGKPVVPFHSDTSSPFSRSQHSVLLPFLYCHTDSIDSIMTACVCALSLLKSERRLLSSVDLSVLDGVPALHSYLQSSASLVVHCFHACLVAKKLVKEEGFWKREEAVVKGAALISALLDYGDFSGLFARKLPTSFVTRTIEIPFHVLDLEPAAVPGKDASQSTRSPLKTSAAGKGEGTQQHAKYGPLFNSIGITFSVDPSSAHHEVAVARLRYNSPAHLAGIRKHDKILSINGIDASGLSHERIAQLVYAPNRPQNEPLVVVVKRLRRRNGLHPMSITARSTAQSLATVLFEVGMIETVGGRGAEPLRDESDSLSTTGKQNSAATAKAHVVEDKSSARYRFAIDHLLLGFASLPNYTSEKRDISNSQPHKSPAEHAKKFATCIQKMLTAPPEHVQTQDEVILSELEKALQKREDVAGLMFVHSLTRARK